MEVTTELTEALRSAADQTNEMRKETKIFWYKDLVMYALHVRAFYDSNADGIGDFFGLTQKLDYLSDLGVNALWLLPFFPSPMKDDGYDVSDFCNIHPDYGTLDQFKTFLAEAKKRDIKVILELVMNHTSDQHEWFKRARKAPAGSNERDFYIWSDTQERFSDVRILFPSYETSNWAWDFEARQYYFHRFFNHQPDLNYDNIEVQKEMTKVVDFWLDMGVDGLILSSAAYLFKREGTNCENLPDVHHFIKKLRRHIDEKYPNRILLGEANMWPEDVAEYYGEGDEIHVNFHYPLMPRLFMAVQTEDSFPIVDILKQTPTIPQNAQWALFLRNHNELTLEMVTDEERDYLRNALAQDPAARLNKGIRRRLSRLVGNDRRKMELLNILLFSLPGAPILYYGDEIGMGDNIYLGDRNGVRTPMQWNAGLNAGFSEANPQKLFLPVINDPLYRHEAVNVANQQRNLASLLWWMKRLISVRQKLKAFSQGSMEFVECLNAKILAFVRKHGDENILIVVNLSSYPQAGKLRLTDYVGQKPVEIFSQNKFLRIKEELYPIFLAPYGYYWLSIEKIEEEQAEQQQYKVPQIIFDTAWKNVFNTFSTRNRLEKQVLENYMMQCRWFDGKSKKIVAIQIIQAIPVEYEEGEFAFFLQVQVRYTTGLPDSYNLPVAFIRGDSVTHYEVNYPKSIICEVLFGEGKSIVVDAMSNNAFTNYLFNQMAKGTVKSLQKGAFHFLAGKVLKPLNVEQNQVKSKLLSLEQSNTSVLYSIIDEKDQTVEFFFKLYRKLETGLNPELELVRFLSEQTTFKNSPTFAGGLEYKETPSESVILGLLQQKIPNQGDAWPLMLDSLDMYYQMVLAKTEKQKAPDHASLSTRLAFDDVSVNHQKLITSLVYDRVVKLATRTGEMHLALASDASNLDFKPEPFSKYYQRSLYASHRKLVEDKFNLLDKKYKNLPLRVKKIAKDVLDLKPDILECFQEIYSSKIDAMKTRVHGDYHLGQVLFNGKDFFIIDFEGEPNATLGERRLKRTPFKDVAGMLRSFHYAAYGKILMNKQYQRRGERDIIESWADLWYQYVSRFYLTAYFDTVGTAEFIPKNQKATDLLLRTYLLEKAVYEMGYELNSRPDWLIIPLTGIMDIMNNYLKDTK